MLIDGVEFIPSYRSERPRVGVAITTRNRPDVLKTTLEHIRQFTPDALVVVVDDASTPPAPEATYRFSERAGVAAAKNKCIELLMDAGCTELFLLDDDCYPITQGWVDQYIDHPEPHLCYLFKTLDANGKPVGTPATIYEDSRTKAFDHPMGCLLYMNRSVIERCGGMRTVFGVWGHEHVEYSIRINNSGLTTNAFQDVAWSYQYIYSIDEHWYKHPEFKRSVSDRERSAQIARNDEILDGMRESTVGFVPYRQLGNEVITTMLTRVVDPQRKNAAKLTTNDFAAWRKSIKGAKSVILTDAPCESDGGEFASVEHGLNPYLQRWIVTYHHLREHESAWVWVTDGTDVEMLSQPWLIMKPGTLYVGYEPTVLDIPWMRQNHPPYQQWITENGDLQLLNAGVVGGDHATVLEFSSDMVREIFRVGPGAVKGDMAAFNYVARSPKWRDRIVWGSRWLTTFKANERNDWSVWKHK
ncbi:TPA_asm: glycosyltransferase [Mycobacterium phage prophiFSQJ01-1]|nr:TPA_asm: glycosyltransferase [Mycobacterium phage prophiFSQJ01-1]